ncbi:prolyl oligopeptidase family serine peptidase [Alteromonas sp. ASW11-36]|uniref:Prolyl oligopeptidase family serine peptidase n=1 Tax=Alteromonas arenosi TaxID=3055817 RepID=A0ABT7SX73_9ALTE|nr:prolyl oligopeptidase family serine peptidase [Alteromonas sp. ASW11-36]MDM7860761.1 prolyl oligopeptidase family serine peptidase [Alteromonas sp. ASW11-36]
MKNTHKFLLVMGSAVILSACAATQSTNGTVDVVAPPSASQPEPTIITPVVDSNAMQDDIAITLEQIMADPDWLGRQPEAPSWSLNGEHLVYERKRVGSHLRDFYLASPGVSGNGEKVALAQLHQVDRSQQVSNANNDLTAWVFDSNIFLYDHSSGVLRQLTKDSDYPRNLTFLSDERLAYQVGNSFIAIDPSNGMREELVKWQYASKPQAVRPPADFIAQEQQELIEYVALQRRQRQEQADYDAQLQAQNNGITAAPFYLTEGHRNVQVALSPNAQYVIVVSTEDTPSRSESDIMPNYIQENGRIAAEEVRRRVSDAKPITHKLWLLDLAQNTVSELSLNQLPGYNDDVLAAVKRENAAARGEDYQVNRLPRAIGILQSWYGHSAIQWHTSGEHVAIMLEAWDNKDRWIVTVDFDQQRLVTQHRLSDEAWINYAFNQFGWLPESPSLYYLSEQSGYSHLYVKPVDGKERALTQGRFEVDDITISRDEQWAYFKANVKHPGIYEIYRAPLSGGEIQALTDLNGMTDYSLSPDHTTLLLTHSTLTMPPELYTSVISDDAMTQPVKITSTVSDEFLSMPWVAPSIVPVESSHSDAPIYSRVYLPTNVDESEPRRAVIFNHGAGYLQNAHMGWSGYFREFMFHSMLVQQGYVVMDMDYRASKGYGRDWRTAIYRQMGTPETQDLVDGVEWLVANANVDRNRVGTYGGSYGGFMTFMALFTEPDLFQAGAALRPVSDWAHYNHPYTSNILNTPDVDPIAYRRSSPIYFAEGLSKPLLMNAPMIDDNVFFVDVVRLVQRLIELEKENFETAIYPVEPHGFVQPSSWLDEYRRIYKLFEQHL